MVLGLRSDPVELFEIGLVSVDPIFSVWFKCFLKQVTYELGFLIWRFWNWVFFRNSEFLVGFPFLQSLVEILISISSLFECFLSFLNLGFFVFCSC